MLLLHRQRHAVRTPQEQHVLAAQIEAKDRQIDRLVYALCGLSAEEIRIVEGRKMGRALAAEEGKWSTVNGQWSMSLDAAAAWPPAARRARYSSSATTPSARPMPSRVVTSRSMPLNSTSASNS